MNRYRGPLLIFAATGVHAACRLWAAAVPLADHWAIKIINA